MFNAGKGAVFTHEGINELDAAIMDGSDLSAGAVAGVTDIRNPISAARKVMDASPHVMLSGKGASEFAASQGLEIVDPSYFYTERRYQDLQRALEDEKHGTVGCVALDMNGDLAAGTSTGGMTNKRYNRVCLSSLLSMCRQRGHRSYPVQHTRLSRASHPQELSAGPDTVSLYRSMTGLRSPVPVLQQIPMLPYRRASHEVMHPLPSLRQRLDCVCQSLPQQRLPRDRCRPLSPRRAH